MHLAAYLDIREKAFVRLDLYQANFEVSIGLAPATNWESMMARVLATQTLEHGQPL